MQKVEGVKELADIPYSTIYEFYPHGKNKGKTVCIAYGKVQVFPWAVGYCGGTHYFGSAQAAAAYCEGRGFIPGHTTEAMTAKLMEEYQRIYGKDYAE